MQGIGLKVKDAGNKTMKTMKSVGVLLRGKASNVVTMESIIHEPVEAQGLRLKIKGCR